MWRADPLEVKELRKALISLYGLPIGFVSLQALDVDLPNAFSLAFSCLALVATLTHYRLNIQDHFRHRLARRRMNSSNPHAIHARVTVGENERATEDFGVLRFDGGFVRFEGLRTEFSIPRHLLEEGPDGKEYVQGEDAKVALRFHRWESRRKDRVLSPPKDSADAPRREDPVTLLPTECPLPKVAPAQVRHLMRTYAFWFLFIAIAYAQHSYLGARNLREAQTVLETTLALTLFASAIPPTVRIGRLFAATRTQPAPGPLHLPATPVSTETLDPAHVAARPSIR